MRDKTRRSTHYLRAFRGFGGEGLLIDVNYLSNLFQKEMSLATERIFARARDGARKDEEELIASAVGAD